MLTAKLFKNGRSQAVRLPKEFRFEGTKVYINKIGESVILIPFHAPWSTLLDSLDLFTDDFMEDRSQVPPQEREDAFQ